MAPVASPLATPLDLQNVSQSFTADPQAIPPTQIHHRVSHLTGVCERSVASIVSQRREGPPMSPVKRSTLQGKVSAVDDFDIADESSDEE